MTIFAISMTAMAVIQNTSGVMMRVDTGYNYFSGLRLSFYFEMVISYDDDLKGDFSLK